MKSAFVDVDTQIDFVFPAGALYAPGAEKILPVVAALNRYAAAHGTTVVSTMDAHREDDPEFAKWPHHCVAGTASQQKPAATLLDRRVVVPSVRGFLFSLDSCRQILVEKQTIDLFTNPNLPFVLDYLQAQRYVVYGVVTEICVRCAAFGLLERGKLVELVTDAVQGLNGEEVRCMYADFTAAGGRLTTSAAAMS
jgi:nicotinamidase/pyrazinamidase